MGLLQALETIKVLTKPAGQNTDDRPALHIFSAYSNPPFRTIRLRGRRANCAVCSSESTITLETLQSGSTDYVQFCGSASFPQVLSKNERISVREFEPIYDSKKYTLVDVRDPVQFGICNLNNSINIPISRILQGKTPDNTDSKESLKSLLPPDVASTDSTNPIYFVCRMGNDSQLAVQKLKELGLDQDGKRFIGDIRGGLKAWKAEVDPEWPEY
jgi:adenylyltransferase/sulfurtransferase